MKTIRLVIFILILMALAFISIKGLPESDSAIDSYMKSSMAFLEPLPKTCIDTDGDEVFNNQLVTKGTVVATIGEQKWTFKDICIRPNLIDSLTDGFNSRIIRENRCDNKEATQIDITCPRFAPWCQDGRCVSTLSTEDTFKLEQRD